MDEEELKWTKVTAETSKKTDRRFYADPVNQETSVRSSRDPVHQCPCARQCQFISA